MSTRDLVQLSFGGIVFPYTQITLSGAIRDHVHEYPHTPGGAPEKLGRKLYEFDIDVPFQDNFAKYPGLWPQNYRLLVTKFENQETDDLVIPMIGSAVRAYCTNWKTVLSSRNTSGIVSTLQFREDSEALRLIQSAFSTKAQSISSARDAMDSEIRATPGLNRNLFDTVMFAVDDLLAYKDQFDLYTNLIEAKCLSVISMLRNISDTMQELKDPDRWRVVEALHNLWASVRELYNDQKSAGITTRWWTTNKDHLTLSQVSTAIYGFSSKGGEILTLNSLPDPFDIRLGTRVRYYAEAA